MGALVGKANMPQGVEPWPSEFKAEMLVGTPYRASAEAAAAERDEERAAQTKRARDETRLERLKAKDGDKGRQEAAQYKAKYNALNAIMASVKQEILETDDPYTILNLLVEALNRVKKLETPEVRTDDA